jgi:DNA-binding MarR family transcriptional regulator
MPRKPVDQLNAGRSYYARHLPGLDVEYFAPLWHLFTVGHLVTTDLDALARRFGCSFADLDLLGTLAIDERRPLRATDLASALYVSNAVISTRIARLEREGLLQRRKNDKDRRALDLVVTPRGRALIEAAIVAIAREAKIVRFFQELAPSDRAALARILGDLHQRFDREFVGGPYSND